MRSFEGDTMDDRTAQEAVVRRWRGERVKADPERAFLIGPGTEDKRHERPFATQFSKRISSTPWDLPLCGHLNVSRAIAGLQDVCHIPWMLPRRTLAIPRKMRRDPL